MKYQVRGIRRDNGKPAIATIEAATRAEAERKASARIVVTPAAHAHAAVVEPIETSAPDSPAADSEPSDVVPGFEAPAAPSLDYATPAATHRRGNGSTAILPEYRDILTGNRWLKFLAAVVAGVAWVIIAFGLLMIVIEFWPSSPAPASNSPFGPFTPSSVPLWLRLMPGLAVISYGVIWIIVSAAIKLACGIGMAVRDMARLAAAR